MKEYLTQRSNAITFRARDGRCCDQIDTREDRDSYRDESDYLLVIASQINNAEELAAIEAFYDPIVIIRERLNISTDRRGRILVYMRGNKSIFKSFQL